MSECYSSTAPRSQARSRRAGEADGDGGAQLFRRALARAHGQGAVSPSAACLPVCAAPAWRCYLVYQKGCSSRGYTNGNARAGGASVHPRAADVCSRQPTCCSAVHAQGATWGSHAQVREYRADVAKLRERAREAAAADSGGAAARAELGLGDDWAASNAGQRDRMLRSTERLEQTGDRIKQGRQQLLETEARPHTPAQRTQTMSRRSWGLAAVWLIVREGAPALAALCRVLGKPDRQAQGRRPAAVRGQCAVSCRPLQTWFHG